MLGGFDQEGYLNRKKWERWKAWIGMGLGSLVILDSGMPLPVPLVGLPSILVGCALFVYGYFEYRNYKKLPLHDALELGRSQNGELSRTDLFVQLQLTTEQTDELLAQLIRHGFLEPLSEDLPEEQELRYRVLH